MNHAEFDWLKVLGQDELAEGRVKLVTCAQRTLCMTHFEGQYGALDNRCPHQGGPLGEGSIENGLLRCPWHGWDFHPLTGKAPGFDDGVETFAVETRDDGVYVGFPKPGSHVRTVGDVLIETMVNWGVKAGVQAPTPKTQPMLITSAPARAFMWRATPTARLRG